MANVKKNNKTEGKKEALKKENTTKNVILIAVAALAVIALGISIFTTALSGSKESSKIMNDFNKYMSSKKETVIYFGSSKCGYCELQTPIMKQIKKDYNMDYLFIDATKLDTKDRNKILKTLKIEGSTPTISVVKNNKVVDTNVGYIGGNEMVEFLKDNNVLNDDAVYSQESNLDYISYEEYEKLIEDGTKTVVVIGQTTCSHCIAVKPVINKIAKEYDIRINYLNLTDMSQDEQTKLTESLKSIGYAEADNLGTPLTLVIENKQIINKIEGETTPSHFKRVFIKTGIIEN